MGRVRTREILSQDKAILALPRKSATPRVKCSSPRFSAFYGFLGRRWPLFAALVGVVSAAAGPHVGLGLNLSASAPRGIYRAVAGTPARGSLVVACLPASIAAFGRAHGYLAAGDCPGGAQPVLKRVGADAGDVIELSRTTVSVNGVRVLVPPTAGLDSAARPLPHAPFGFHRVAASEVWLFGVSPTRSWDSRYFGSVPARAVRSVVRPVLTLD